MKLKDILPENTVYIEYRTNGPYETDILAGFAKWENGVLIPTDYDNWSVNDEISSYEWEDKNNLTVWYESRWISG